MWTPDRLANPVRSNRPSSPFPRAHSTSFSFWINGLCVHLLRLKASDTPVTLVFHTHICSGSKFQQLDLQSRSRVSPLLSPCLSQCHLLPLTRPPVGPYLPWGYLFSKQPSVSAILVREDEGSCLEPPWIPVLLSSNEMTSLTWL